MVSVKTRKEYIVRKLSNELLKAIDERDKALADILRVQLDSVQFPHLFAIHKSLLCKE